ALGESQCRRPGDPSESRDTEDAQGERDVEDRLTEIGRDRQREYQRWKRQQHVDPADHQRLQGTAEITREHPQTATDYKTKQWREQADGQRIRAPNMMRLRISRPSASAPSQ